MSTKKIFLGRVAAIIFFLLATNLILIYPSITSAEIKGLQISSLVISPATGLKEGMTINFKATIKNTSTENAQNVVVRFFVDDKQIGEKTITKIYKNSSTYVTQSYTLPNGSVGEHRALAMIGGKTPSLLPQEEKIKSPEIKFTVLPISPDLSIVPNDISFYPANIKGGDKVTLKAKVKNIGTDPVKNFKVAFYFNKEKIFEKTISSLGKNAYSTAVYQYQLPPNISGNQNFIVKIDEENTVSEIDEKNNEAEKIIPVNKAERDLIIDDIKPSPTNPKVGQNVTWQIKIKNIGNSDAKNFKVYFYANNQSNTPTTILTIDKLSKNQTVSRSIKWTVPSNISPAIGYTVRAVVDPENTVAETNESNNLKLYSLNLTAPDLKLEILKHFPDYTAYCSIYEENDKVYPPPGRSSMLTLCAQITNDNVMAVNNVKVVLYYRINNDTNLIKLGEKVIPTIPKKGIVPLYFEGNQPSNMPIGTKYHLVMKVDDSNAIVETNEENNTINAIRTLVAFPPRVQYPYLRVSVFNEVGDLLDGATVKLTDLSTNNTETKVASKSGTIYTDTGAVVFDARPAHANYKLEVSAPGYRTSVENLVFDTSESSVLEKMVYLDKKALVTGTVKNVNGQPIAGAKVKIEGIGLETKTDTQGKYGFLLNGNQSYTFRFLARGYERAIKSNYFVTPLANQILDQTLTNPYLTEYEYIEGVVTDDEGNPIVGADIYVTYPGTTGQTRIGATDQNGRFMFRFGRVGTWRVAIKKTGYVETDFLVDVPESKLGDEDFYNVTMYPPTTKGVAEKGAIFVSWHQQEGTPANAFFIPEYNVNVWWGVGRIKMKLGYETTNNQTKLNYLRVTARGDKWECHKVEGEGEISGSGIDIPITLAAGGCNDKITQIDVYRVAIESNGQEVWKSSEYWSTGSYDTNVNSRRFDLNNLPVNWNENLKVKVWLKVRQKNGDAGALAGYHLDRKLITWYPQKPPTTKIGTSWRQVGGYLLGILDNPLNAVANFTDLFTVQRFEQFEMTEVMPANFPDNIPE